MYAPSIYSKTSQQHQLNQRHTSHQKIIYIHLSSLQQQAAGMLWATLCGHLIYQFFNNYTLKFHHEAKMGEQKSAHLKTN